MDIAKATRAKIYEFMTKEPETVNIVKVGENKDLDKKVNDFLELNYGMNYKNASNKPH